MNGFKLEWQFIEDPIIGSVNIPAPNRLNYREREKAKSSPSILIKGNLTVYNISRYLK